MLSTKYKTGIFFSGHIIFAFKRKIHDILSFQRMCITNRDKINLPMATVPIIWVAMRNESTKDIYKWTPIQMHLHWHKQIYNWRKFYFWKINNNSSTWCYFYIYVKNLSHIINWLLAMTISHVSLSYSQYSNNIILSCKIVVSDWLRDIW